MIWERQDGAYLLSKGIEAVPCPPPGAYSLYANMKSPLIVREFEMQTESMDELTEPQLRVVSEVNQFLQSRERYQRLGFTFRRGVLAYGPPGTGKTALMRAVARETIAAGGYVIAAPSFVEGEFPELLSRFKNVISAATVVLMEDIDNQAEDSDFHNVIDGLGNSNGLLFLATSNNIDIIPARLRRPGRFDMVLEVGFPEEDYRRRYIQRILKGEHMELLEMLVAASAGESLAHMRERVVSALVFDRLPLVAV